MSFLWLVVHNVWIKKVRSALTAVAEGSSVSKSRDCVRIGRFSGVAAPAGPRTVNCRVWLSTTTSEPRNDGGAGAATATDPVRRNNAMTARRFMGMAAA